MALIDFDKFLASFITEMKECSQMRNFSIPRCIKKTLLDQELDYKNGEIVKVQRRISAEAKEVGYCKSEDDKEIVKLADEYYDKVLLKECDMKEKEAHHCRIAYIHGAKAMLEKQGEQKPVEFNDTNAKRMFIKALERVEEENNKGYKLTDCDKNSWWEDFKVYTLCTIKQNHAWNEKCIADVFEKVGLAKIVREQSNDALTNALQSAMIELSKFMLQQKPAWNEEIDLEKECKNYLKNNFTSKEAPDEFLTTQMQLDDMVLFAKHFYELGLAQKGE